MGRKIFWVIGLSFLFSLSTENAAGHVVIEEQTAVAGQNTLINFRVIHGCNGSPTTGLRIELPQGITYLTPRYKSGWTVSVKREKITAGNNQVIDHVREVAWSGGMIPPDAYDRFEFEIRIPDTIDGQAFFKTIQVCQDDDIRYVDIPENRSLPWETPNPAPSIEVIRQ